MLHYECQLVYSSRKNLRAGLEIAILVTSSGLFKCLMYFRVHCTFKVIRAAGVKAGASCLNDFCNIFLW